jgi:4-diphosphocytidyl-2-C-methyl-D-erythritol kinase
MPLVRRCPCKINLLLNILGKRPDGFHELETVFHPVNLCDELQFEPTSNGIELTCDLAELGTDSTNLVVRAANAFFLSSKVKCGVRIRLAKRIPLAAGLGGGSSDAAQTLLGLNRLFDSPLPATDIQKLAAQLGSDVPFFLQNQPALGLGRGELIEPLEPFTSLRGVWALLIHPGFGVSTAWAYQNLASFPDALNGRAGRARELANALHHAPASQALSLCYNSLEAPVLTKYPILAMFQEFLRSEGALTTLMSGSGSTTFALAESRHDVDRIAERFRDRFGSSNWLTTVPLTGNGANS